MKTENKNDVNATQSIGVTEMRNGYRADEEIEYGSDYPQEYE